jgi:hypothetical protein
MPAWQTRQGAPPATTIPQRKRHPRGADPHEPRSYARGMESMEPITIARDFSAFSVRDGRLAPVTCVACGCRLERHDDDSWWHFRGRGDRDARGCIVACAEQPHYAPGGIAAVLG